MAEPTLSEAQNLFTFEQPLGPPAIIPELHLRSLSAIYLDELTPYSRGLPPTNATYIMGRRGSGKTTLLVAADGFDQSATIPLFESDVLTGMLDLIQHVERDLRFTLSQENRIELWKATFEFAAAVHLSSDISANSNVAERLQIRQFLARLRDLTELGLQTTADYVRAFEEYISRNADITIKGPLRGVA